MFNTPKHPNRKGFIWAISIPNPEKVRDKLQLKEEIPSPPNLPNGCTFSYTKSFYNRDMPTC
ncbi:hypothetical protein [Oceanobacillus rekensis]|uniref:hypothetical protein n=1 Tax=Oceanobacillus rekensis TaxID=937927 RepID=UPI0015940EFC|nr:hypothetical protein [Oceanobacillus rekensis]